VTAQSQSIIRTLYIARILRQKNQDPKGKDRAGKATENAIIGEVTNFGKTGAKSVVLIKKCD
jgi:hypothetical protein